MAKASMTLAEGRQDKDFRTDALLVLNGVTVAGRVQRTALVAYLFEKPNTLMATGDSPFYLNSKPA